MNEAIKTAQGRGLNRQRGVVLLVLFMILFMAGASVFLTLMNNNVVRQQQNSDVMSALSAARDVLISYAALHGDYYGDAGAGPGHLPCPDTNSDGQENAPCNAVLLSRLPQAISTAFGNELPLGNFESEVDQQFWYAVSPAFRRSPAGVVNTSVNGALTLDGRSGYAAVIIAPGEALASQSRPGNNAANYLEAGNTAMPDFVSLNPADPDNFNDRVLGITATQIHSLISATVVEKIKQTLDAYHGLNGQYPIDADFAAAMATAPAWFAANNWGTVTSYTRLSNDSAQISFANCAIVYTLTEAMANIARTGTQC